VSLLDQLIGEVAGLLGGAKKDDAAAKPAGPAAEIAASNQRLRDTAKWILTSFAAVGAILVGGLQLSNIGKLTGETPDTRVWATLVGIAVAAFGVAVAIGFMSSVLQPTLNSFRSADKNTDVADRALAEPMGLTYAQLKAKIAEKDAAVETARKNHGYDSDAYRDALAERNAWEETRQDALTLIGTELLWHRYTNARRAVLVAIFLILGGVVAFAWGANPPEDEKEKPAVTLGQAPLLLDVHLSDAAVAALKKARGCKTADLQVLSIGGKTGEREVVTVPAGGCKPVRFVLTPTLGTATAAEAP
jgi:hypothetical protein